MTGLPAAGKTTLARVFTETLMADGHGVCWIDGDDLRATVSRDLDFSRDGRGTNARRACVLACAAVARGEIAVVSLVSPFRTDRGEARATVQAAGTRFVEVFVDTPLDECRRRDPKGLYAAAVAGRLAGLTGWDAPYEAPLVPEVHVTCGAEPLAMTVTRLRTAAALQR
jgi:adenylyl-sulfate kinase